MDVTFLVRLLFSRSGCFLGPRPHPHRPFTPTAAFLSLYFSSPADNDDPFGGDVAYFSAGNATSYRLLNKQRGYVGHGQPAPLCHSVTPPHRPPLCAPNKAASAHSPPFSFKKQQSGRRAKRPDADLKLVPVRCLFQRFIKIPSQHSAAFLIGAWRPAGGGAGGVLCC